MRLRCRREYRHRTHTSRCWHRGWVFGLCVEHALERVRFSHHGRHHYVVFDASNLNRPYIQIDQDRPISYIELSWGNGNSDPAFSIGWQRP